MKRTMFCVLVSVSLMVPRIAVADAATPLLAPPDIANVVQFVRGVDFLDIRKYRQILDSTTSAIIGQEAACAFDVPPGTTQVDYWHINGTSSRVKDPLTAAEIAGRKEAANARNALVFQTFPDWATDAIAFRIDTENRMNQAFSVSIPANETRAVYIAFGKIKGPYTKPGGIASFEFYNNGEYVIERDGANTKGYIPVALCALLRTPRTF